MQGFGGDGDHAGVGLPDAHLVGVDLDVEVVDDPVLLQQTAVREARVGVRHDADGDALMSAELEELGNSGAEDVVRHRDRDRREQLGGLRDDEIASALR